MYTGKSLDEMGLVASPGRRITQTVGGVVANCWSLRQERRWLVLIFGVLAYAHCFALSELVGVVTLSPLCSETYTLDSIW